VSSEKYQVAIIMGSDSDMPIMNEAAKVLDALDISYRAFISSAHRTPKKTACIVQDAEQNGAEVIIAGAGLAAHLPGVIAALTVIPVIGVPIKAGALNGVDALYSIVQMPPGIPVATVAINGGKNAGVLAAQILAAKYPVVKEHLLRMRKKAAEDVVNKDVKLAQLGMAQYIKEMQ